MVPYPGAISNGVSDGWSGGFLVSLRVVMRVLMSISVHFVLVWGVGLGHKERDGRESQFRCGKWDREQVQVL
jgi:hypothetical protein